MLGTASSTVAMSEALVSFTRQEPFPEPVFLFNAI